MSLSLTLQEIREVLDLDSTNRFMFEDYEFELNDESISTITLPIEQGKKKTRAKEGDKIKITFNIYSQKKIQ